jgi:hypothetical protein
MVPDNSPPLLTTKEWLQRIEGSLTRIEDKLDTKAERAELLALESRLRLIESMGTEHSRKAVEDVRALTIKETGDMTLVSKDLNNLKVKVYAIMATVALLATVAEVIRQGIGGGG